ncbi:hypothetical protein Tco_1581073 [Tanacetum coccineum]
MGKQSMNSSFEKLWYLIDEYDEDETYEFDMNEFPAIQIHNNFSSKSLGTQEALYYILDEKYDVIACDFSPKLELLLASELHIPRQCYNEYERMFAEDVILIGDRLVKLMNISLEQWLDLKYGEHKKVDKEIVEGIVGTWLIRSYKKQFKEYMEIKSQLEVCGINTMVECDPTNIDFAEWLASKFSNHRIMHWYTKNALWLYWKRGDDEEVLTKYKLSGLEEENVSDENEIAEIFRIETDIFLFETPLCKAFKEFNYLL